MQLISDTADTGGPETSKYPPIFPLPPGPDLTSPLTFMDGPPNALFARYREAAPVAWQPGRSGDGGAWSLTRYADVMAVDGDPVGFSSQRGGILMGTQKSDMQLAKASLDAMINMDAPSHMQLRREHMPFFTVRYLDTLRPGSPPR